MSPQQITQTEPASPDPSPTRVAPTSRATATEGHVEKRTRARTGQMAQHSSRAPDGGSESGPGTMLARGQPPAVPKRLVALRRKRRSGGTYRYYFNIGRFLRESPIEVGDLLHIELDQSEGPKRLRVARVEDEEAEAREENQNRKVKSEARGARLPLPKRLLGEYELDVDTESYDDDDPLVFQAQFVPDAPVFELVALGKLSDVFGYAEDAFIPGESVTADGEFKSIGPSIEDVAEAPVGRNPPPAVEEELNDALAETGDSLPLPVGEIRSELEQIARWVSDDTLDALGKSTEAGFETVEWAGQRIAVHYVDPYTAFDLACNIFPRDRDTGPEYEAVPPSHGLAVRRYHFETGAELVAAKYDQRPPADHPMNGERPVDPVCIPLGRVEDSGETVEEGIPRATGHLAAPIAQRRVAQLVSAQGIDRDRLYEALDTLTNEVDGDRLLEQGLLSDADGLAPVQVPTVPDTFEPADYDSVVVAFVPEGAVTDLAEQEDIPLELANLVRTVHNVEAESVLTEATESPPSRPVTETMRRFRNRTDADAIVLPAPAAGDLDLDG